MRPVRTRIRVARTRAILAMTLFGAPAALVVVGSFAGRPHSTASATMASYQEPQNLSALRAVSSVADLESGALATAGMSGEAALQLFAFAGSATTEITALALAREEHSLALAADSEVSAEIRAGGLTNERAMTLAQAESRLA